jgi:anthranilate phosphoribosyltransferase
MGLSAVTRVQETCDVLARHDPVFVPVEVFCAPLASLLAAERRLGVRHVGHTISNLVDPCGSARSLLLTSCATLGADEVGVEQEYFVRTGADALVMCGTDGEIVAAPGGATCIDWVHDGLVETLAQTDSLPFSERPVLPAADDPGAAASWIQSVLSGERSVPRCLEIQVEIVLRVVGARDSLESSRDPSM